MAIDTQAKRMAAAGAGRVFMRAVLPGTIDQTERVSAGIGYPVATLQTSAGAEFLSFTSQTGRRYPKKIRG